MIRTSVILAFAMAFFAVTTGAQESATPPSEPESEQKAQPISATQIAIRADRLQGEIATTLDTLRASEGEVDAISKKTAELRAELQSALERVDRSEIASMRQSDAEKLTQNLNRSKLDLKKWREELQGRTDPLDKKQQVTKAELDYFERIAASAESEDLPDALVERSVRINASLKELREVIRDRLSVLIRNLSEVSELERLIREYQQLIAASVDQRSQNMLSLEYPVLWKVPPSGTNPVEQLQTEVRSRLDASIEYIRLKSFEFLVLFLVLLPVIMAALKTFSMRSAKLPPDSSGVRLNLRKRPFAVVFLLWASLGPELLLTQLPAGLTTLRLLIMIIALWRLLPALLPVREQRLVPAILILLTVVAVLDLWPIEYFMGRLANVGVSIVGLVLFLQLGKSFKAEKEATTLWRVVGQLLTSLGPPLFGIAAFCSVAGVVTLGVQITHGLLWLFGSFLVLMVVEMTLNVIVEIFVAGAGQKWLRFIRNNPQAVQRRTANIIRFVMLVLLVSFIPRLFPLAHIAYDWVGETLGTEFELGSVVFSFSNILVLIIGVYLAVTVSRFIRLLLDEDVFPRLPIAPGAASAATRLIYYGLVTGSIFLVLAASGVELGSLTLLISALGVGIGFGLQGIVNNFVSGLVLAFERPLQVGDIIAVGELTGRVRQIGIRASRVRTFEGAEVIVPNSQLIAGEVINWTLSDRMRRVEVNVGVAYGSDTTEVRNALLKVAEEHEKVAKYPQPEALFLGFGDSDMRFNLRIWISEAGEWPQISSDLYEAVNLALADQGIVIPFPQRTVHLNSPTE